MFDCNNPNIPPEVVNAFGKEMAESLINGAPSIKPQVESFIDDSSALSIKEKTVEVDPIKEKETQDRVDKDLEKLSSYNLLELYRLLNKLSTNQNEYESGYEAMMSAKEFGKSMKESIAPMSKIADKDEIENLQFRIDTALEDPSFKEFSEEYVRETAYLKKMIPSVQAYIDEHFTVEKKSSMKYMNECRVEILDKKIADYENQVKTKEELLNTNDIEPDKLEQTKAQIKHLIEGINRMVEMKGIILTPFDLSDIDRISQHDWVIKDLEKFYVNRKMSAAKSVSELFKTVQKLSVAKAAVKIYRMCGKPYVYAADLFLLHLEKQIEKSKRKGNLKYYRIRDLLNTLCNIELGFCDYPANEIKEFEDQLDEILYRYKISTPKRIMRQKKPNKTAKKPKQQDDTKISGNSLNVLNKPGPVDQVIKTSTIPLGKV